MPCGAGEFAYCVGALRVGFLQEGPEYLVHALEAEVCAGCEAEMRDAGGYGEAAVPAGCFNPVDHGWACTPGQCLPVLVFRISWFWHVTAWGVCGLAAWCCAWSGVRVCRAAGVLGCGRVTVLQVVAFGDLF
jgi:hypothetical protein